MKILGKIVAVVAVLVGTMFGQNPAPYVTQFPQTESVISEGSNWKNGLADGTDWGNVQTTNGATAHAYGTTTTTSCGVGSGNCNDSTAVLTGSYGAIQTACGVPYLASSGFSRNAALYEIELRVNTSISSHSITGYEMDYSTHNDGSQYIEIVRWNGAKNQFTILNSLTPTRVITVGDTVCLTHVGSTLQAYINGVAQFTGGNAVSDSTYTGGAPGMGFYNQNGASADNIGFGWSNFFGFGQTSGGVQVLTDCTTATLSTAITAAANAGSVVLPACNVNWTSGVSVTSKYINLLGQGSGRIIGTSTSTITLGTGSKTLTAISAAVGKTLQLFPGQFIKLSETGTRGNSLTGTVTSFSGGTLVFNATSSTGTCGGASSGGTSNCGRWLISTTPVTNITNNSASTLFSLTENGTGHINWGDIKVTQGTGNGNIINLNFTNLAQAILVHDCWMEQGNGDDIFSNTNRGLIWNCSFDSSPFSMEPLAIHLKEPSPTGTMAQSWTTTAKWGALDTDGQAALYAETNDFHAYLNSTDADDNGRFVFRYNMMNNAGFGTHGADTSTYGQRYFEFYNNTGLFSSYSSSGSATKTFNMNWWIFMRGGTFVAHDNTMPAISSVDYGSKPDVSTTVMNLQRNAGPDNCWAALASSCITATPGQYYHAPRQMGFGRVTGTGVDGLGRTNDSITYVGDSEPIYIWNNSRSWTGLTTPDSGAGSGTNCGNLAACDVASNYFKVNRDYFLSAKPSYTAFTYPNPLSGIASNPVVAPIFSPAAGTYSSAQTVTITSATSGATICYTTDGSTPTANGAGTCTHGTTLTNGGTITVSVSQTVQAIGSATGQTDSTVSSAVYTIASGAVTPVLSPSSGTFTLSVSVTITSSTTGATICYTLDGSTPTANGAGVCTSGTTLTNGGSVNLISSKTIRAIASKSGLTDSSPTSGSFVIIPSSTGSTLGTGAGTGTTVWGKGTGTGVTTLGPSGAVTCGPPQYNCSNVTTTLTNLDAGGSLPTTGPNSTVGADQYIAGNQTGGVNTCITDPLSPHSVMCRVTEGGDQTGNASVPSIKGCSLGLTIPSFRGWNADYSGNSTDGNWNMDSTMFVVGWESGGQYCVVPFTPSTMHVGQPLGLVPFKNLAWSHTNKNVLYTVGYSGLAGCTSYCLFKYDFTGGFNNTPTLLYDFQASGKCLAGARTITWDGLLTVTNDDSQVYWPANDGYSNLTTGGQDSGFLWVLWKTGVADGCRILNSAWATASIVSATVSGTNVTLQLPSNVAGQTTTIPTQMLSSGAAYVGLTVRVTGCTGGTNINSTTAPDAFTVSSVNTNTNTITYSTTGHPAPSGACTGGTVSMADAGYPGGTIWGGWGTTGGVLIQNGTNSNTGTYNNNGLGESFKAHEAFFGGSPAPDGHYYGEMSGSSCLSSALAGGVNGTTCPNDSPFFWQVDTNLVVAGYISGHFCPGAGYFAFSTNTPKGQFALFDPSTIGSQGPVPGRTNLINSSGGGNGNLSGFNLNPPNGQVAMGAHCSWNNNGGANNRFIFRQADAVSDVASSYFGTPAINIPTGVGVAVGNMPAAPFAGPYNAEILGYPSANPNDPSALVHRMGHGYSSPYSRAFHSKYFIGPVSQDGNFMLVTTDMLGGGGANDSSSNNCVLGGPDKQSGLVYPLNFRITPLTGNINQHTYRVNTASCAMSAAETAAVFSITGNGTTATFTATAPLSALFATGTSVKLTNAGVYNGTFTITNTGSTTFTFSSSQTSTVSGGTATFQYPGSNYTDGGCSMVYTGDQNCRQDVWVLRLQ